VGAAASQGSARGRRPARAALTTPRLILASAAVAFVAAVAVLALTVAIHDPRERSSDAPGARVPLRAGASTDERIARQQAIARAAPSNPDALTVLAGDYVQKVRETGDASYYARAGDAITRALAVAPHSAGALTERGALRLARHDFRGALQDGLKAHGLVPEVVRPYGVLVDAYVELGRYGDAGRTLQRMVDLKPDLAAYARASYLRELHGDLEGALQAMRLAVSAGGGTPENTAYVETLLGNLHFARGRYRDAASAYRDALARFPRYVPAAAGIARLQAAEGRLGAAIRSFRDVVARLPLPEYVVALGETELAAGRRRSATRDLALVRAEEKLLRANGVNTDTELALYETTHGDPGQALSLARRAWAAAPSVRSADAMGWALTRSRQPRQGLVWARRSLRLGSRDPMLLFHAGMTARAAGRPALARRWLTLALADNPRFSPLWAPRARRALRELG
jgi:tetratricopeptide (TPR) repeat protein